MDTFSLLVAATCMVAAVPSQAYLQRWGPGILLQWKQELTKSVTDEKPSIVYGVMATGSQPYRDKLISQVQTWAAGLVQQRRFFAVAGIGAPAMPAAGLIIEDGCPDDRSGVACKEGRLIEEGYNRGVDWLVILGEDNYVNTERMKEELSERAAIAQAAAPVVLGVAGCGKGTGSMYCKEVDKLGGLCGGAGYALNRAALEALMMHGRDVLRQEYRSLYRKFPGDMASSCALRQRGISFQSLREVHGNRITKAVAFKLTLSRNPLVLHYCTPDVMRWVHAVMQHKPDKEVDSLQAAAFDGGCCCAFQLQQCKKEVAQSAAAMQVAGGPLNFDQLRLAYIKDRSSQLIGRV